MAIRWKIPPCINKAARKMIIHRNITGARLNLPLSTPNIISTSSGGLGSNVRADTTAMKMAVIIAHIKGLLLRTSMNAFEGDANTW